MEKWNRHHVLCLAALAFLAAAVAGCEGGGSHPLQGPRYEAMGSFVNGLAPVRVDGRWGYIDKRGNMAIAPQYAQATPFREGYAVVWTDGRWRVIDTAGNALNLPQLFSAIGEFREGLAAAKDPSIRKWGFIDRTGRFIIAPRFDHADAFSNGLAPVLQDGKWSYVATNGSISLSTEHYRAYSFGKEGLALVQQKRDGPYSYMDVTGTIRLEGFVQARGFSEGLAAARKYARWGYIDAKGDWVIRPQYQAAFPFNGGVALVLENDQYHYIDAKGQALFGGSFVSAQPMSEDVAMVGDGQTLWYVDRSGSTLDIGHARPLTDSGSGCVQGEAEGGVLTQYKGGFVNWNFINLTGKTFNVDVGKGYDYNGNYYPAIPGYPTQVKPFTDATTQGRSSFTLKYLSWESYSSGTYDLFDMSLTSDDGRLAVKLHNAVNYTNNPPGKKDHPWWDFIKGAIDIIKGVAGIIVDDPDEAPELLEGYYELSSGIYDICSGATDGNSDDNGTSTNTNNILNTQISATLDGQPLNSLNGQRCGGDSFTISDGEQYVIELTTAQTDDMPPTINVIIHYWGQYFAENAMARIESFRQSTSPSYMGYPWDCIYQLMYASCEDRSNKNPCSSPTAFPNYSYYGVANWFKGDQALKWWNFANNFDTETNLAGDKKDQSLFEIAQWMETFGGQCGAPDPSCPQTMSVSPTTFTATGSPGDTATWTVTIKNAHPNPGPMAVWVEPMGTVTTVNGTPPCQQFDDKTPLNCTLQFSVPMGTSLSNAYITDGYAKVPITINSQVPAMTVSPTSFTSDLWGENASFDVTVTNPKGPLAVELLSQQPYLRWLGVTNNTCTGPMAKCGFTFVVPMPGFGTINVNDGHGNQQQITYSSPASAPKMTVPQTQFSATTADSCSFNVVVNNPWGPVEISSTASWVQYSISNNTCNRAVYGSCSFTLNLPLQNPHEMPFYLYDGVIKTEIDVTCNPQN